MDSEPSGERSATSAASAPDAEVVLHAERLLVSTERVATERVRLSKRIVTTTRTLEVPVRVEQLVVTREPLPAGTPFTGSPVPPDVEAEPVGARPELVIVLHEEVPEVSLRVVPVERVAVGIRSVVEHDVVTGELATEHVALQVDSPEPHAAGADA